MYKLPLWKYPYTDFHDINLDWIIERIQEMYSIIDQKIADAVNPIITSVNALTTRVDNIDTLISGLTTRMNTAEENITSINNSISTIEDNIEALTIDVESNTADITNLNEEVNSITTTVSTHTTEIADIYEKIAEIDPDTGLIVDANDFNIEEKSATILDPIYNFSLTGSSRNESFVIYPDLIPGTQSGYFTRVTMLEDATTHKIKLPSELTTGSYPLIRRGTFATNVNVNAEIYNGTPLEYSFSDDNRFFYVDGYDSEAIILMNIACIHHQEGYENVYDNYGVIDVKGMPATQFETYIGDVYRGTSASVYGLVPYIYFFDKAGNLLSYEVLSFEGNQIPSGTYSIWYGISTSDDHERWNNTTFGINMYTLSGVYKKDGDRFVTNHVVKFYNSEDEKEVVAEKAGIYGLDSINSINMITGEVTTRYGLHVTDFDISGALSDLEPDKSYEVILPYKNSGYSEAKLKYNKIMVLLDTLNGNNISY